ncbi:MAG TPA: hypothetical protein VKD71_03840 [Gemmataceae bacterium]|nr:hypothetical protein [Gemmataceae bacterium]
MLTLKAKTKSVKAGEVPVFILTIENRGDFTERLIDPRTPGVQGPYFRLTVIQGGKPVKLASALIGVPELRNPYFDLMPGEKVKFELSEFALGVQDLPPGRYQARIRTETHPVKGKSVNYDSPLADFAVEKK